jgi:hypothetical protein
MRHRINQTESLERRLGVEAQSLRSEVRGTTSGIERERLMRRARDAEAASHMNAWLHSPGLRAPT